MTIRLDAKVWQRLNPVDADPAGFGSVFHVEAEDGSVAVAKFVDKDPGAERELLMGDSVRAGEFRNVIPVIDQGEHENQWVIVMPTADYSLAQFTAAQETALAVADVVAILTDIATALADISGAIVHRDLKPQNVLYYDGHWCLADFGIARYAEATTAANTRKDLMTSPYAAPEQWRFEQATSASDVYAFGVLAYELLSGRVPFEGPDFRAQHLYEKHAPLTTGTQRLRGLIDECLYKAADARPLTANVLARLETIADEPTIPGLASLAAANQAEVSRRAEKQAEQSKAKQELAYYVEMHGAALEAFSALAEPLVTMIRENAPAASIDFEEGHGQMTFVAKLGRAKFGLSKPELVTKWSGPFTVVSSATLTLVMDGRNIFGWQGRNHSLWFCDGQEAGHFGWYELAFMTSAFSQQRPDFEPFALPPLAAEEAFSGGIGSMQLGWPLVEVDRSDPSELIGRWLGWFGEAAQGVLSRPSTMPEREIAGSWRRP
jgi:hypothetical protein